MTAECQYHLREHVEACYILYQSVETFTFKVDLKTAVSYNWMYDNAANIPPYLLKQFNEMNIYTSSKKAVDNTE